MFLKLQGGLENSPELSLCTTTDNYRVIRSRLAEANYATRKWLQEPDEEAANRLDDVQVKAWRTCHDSLLEVLNSGQWSPEWLGWLGLSGLYCNSPWQVLNNALKLLVIFFQLYSDRKGDDFQAAVLRSGSILLDESGEPPLLLPVTEQADLIGGRKLASLLKGYPDDMPFDPGEAAANLQSLTSILEALEQLQELFQALHRPAHVKQLSVKISRGIDILESLSGDTGKGSAGIPAAETTPAATGLLPEREQVERAGRVKSVAEPRWIPTVNDREQAKQSLRELIVFFRTTEPHSPVSWQLEKAMGWLDMSFPELLLKMTGEQRALHDEICRRVGLAELTGETAGKPTGNKTADVHPVDAPPASDHQPEPASRDRASNAEPENSESKSRFLKQDLI